MINLKEIPTFNKLKFYSMRYNLLILKMTYLFILLFIASVTIYAQPSGGPYGPVKHSYELPKVKGKIIYVAPNGKSDSDGLTIDKPSTIETAIKLAGTGDAIIMRGGIYRTGNLTFNQGITIQPYADEQPVLKGTLPATNWQKAGNKIWATHWDFLFPAGPEPWWNREHEEKKTPLHRFNNDGVFINGEFLQSGGKLDEVNANTFFVDYNAKIIYIGVDPTNKTIEITAFRKALYRTTSDCNGKKSDGRGPVIKGLEITQYPDTMVHISGFYPDGFSSEQDHGKDVVGTRFENCTFSNCFRIGVFAIGDSMVMKNCKIFNTNTEGLYIVASDDVLLEKNIFENNNIEKWTGFFPGAVKIFNQSHRVICRDNLIINHPYSNGVWYDVGNVDGVFVNNWVEGIGRLDGYFTDQRLWPSDNGFFFEISKGAICAGNVFNNCDHGVMILNSNNVDVYNNTFINSMACFGRNSRGDTTDHFGWHVTTGPSVDSRDGHTFINNLIYTDTNYLKPLLFVWQPAVLCKRLNRSQLNNIDYNVFIRQSQDINAPMTLWSPFTNENCQIAFDSFEEFSKVYPNFALNSYYFKNYKEPLFINKEIKDFHISGQTLILKKGANLPAHIKKVLNLNQLESNFIGAYPIKKE